jgi:periplasmic protein TonB
MSAAADFPRADEDGSALVRWPACLVLVVGLHAAVVLPLLRRAEPLAPFAPPPDAITVDLAPVPEEPAQEKPAPAEEAAAAPRPEPEPLEAPQPVAEPAAEPPPPEEPEQQAEPLTPPEPPPAVAEAVLPEPPPPPPPPPEAVRRPPPPPRPVIRPQAQRPAAEDHAPATGAEARPAPAAPTAPATVQSAASNAVPMWQGQLLGRLQRFKRYPDLARSRREEGVVHLTFAMNREGRVITASIARGSGFPELDAETLALVRRAEPFPAPPPEMPGDPLTLTVPVRFSLRQ